VLALSSVLLQRLHSKITMTICERIRMTLTCIIFNIVVIIVRNDSQTNLRRTQRQHAHTAATFVWSARSRANFVF
jgi:hypothetical protein